MLVILSLLISIPFFLLYGTWVWGVVIQKTWLWFAVPAFGMQPFTFAQAVCASVFVSIFFVKGINLHSPKTASGGVDWNTVVGNIIGGLILPWVVLCLNFILACIFI
jgi:hypothetical protein